MGRHKTETCNACLKSMKSDKLKRHKMRRDHLISNMESHEQENEDNVSTNGQ